MPEIVEHEENRALPPPYCKRPSAVGIQRRDMCVGIRPPESAQSQVQQHTLHNADKRQKSRRDAIDQVVYIDGKPKARGDISDDRLCNSVDPERHLGKPILQAAQSWVPVIVPAMGAATGDTAKINHETQRQIENLPKLPPQPRAAPTAATPPPPARAPSPRDGKRYWPSRVASRAVTMFGHGGQCLRGWRVKHQLSGGCGTAGV